MIMREERRRKKEMMMEVNMLELVAAVVFEGRACCKETGTIGLLELRLSSLSK